MRRLLAVAAALMLAGNASAQGLVENGSFENGLSFWTQGGSSDASFESVPNGGSHSEEPGCTAPAGFPGSGSFWAVSCQGDPAVHVLYQDITVPSSGGVLQLVAGVDMCSVSGGGPCGAGKQRWSDQDPVPSGSATAFWITGKGLEDCSSFTKGDGDCARIDLVDPASDVLDETTGVLLQIGFAESQDFPPEFSGELDLNPWASQTIRLRFWVQAVIAEVALQVDTVEASGRTGIPALQPLGLGLLLVVLGAAGAVFIRRRQRRS